MGKSDDKILQQVISDDVLELLKELEEESMQAQNSEHTFNDEKNCALETAAVAAENNNSESSIRRAVNRFAPDCKVLDTEEDTEGYSDVFNSRSKKSAGKKEGGYDNSEYVTSKSRSSKNNSLLALNSDKIRRCVINHVSDALKDVGESAGIDEKRITDIARDTVNQVMQDIGRSVLDRECGKSLTADEIDTVFNKKLSTYMKNLEHAGHRSRLRDMMLNGTISLDGFSDVQILELMLTCGIRREDTNAIARRLLERFGSLSAILRASFNELLSVKGVTVSSAVYMSIVIQVNEFAAARMRMSEIVFDSALKAKDFFSAYFANRHVESIVCAYLDDVYRVIEIENLAIGTSNQVTLNITKVVEGMLRNHATSIIIAHNHLSGSGKPTSADFKATKELCMVLNMLNCKVNDHIVVGPSGVYCMLSNMKNGVEPHFSGRALSEMLEAMSEQEYEKYVKENSVDTII